MDLLTFYAVVGGDYEDAMGRMGTQERVKRFLLRYPSDEEIVNLQKAHESGDWEQFFRAVHTMKGLCGNLALTKLATAASALTENMRGLVPDDNTETLYQAVLREYEKTIELIAELQ